MSTPEVKTLDLMALCRQIFDSCGTYRLSKKQYAHLTNQSVSSVDRKMRLGKGISRYQKDENGKVYFPVQEVAKFLCTGLTEVY
jgi:hypothetical protein